MARSRHSHPSTPRRYDLVLYGATGFVGRQAVAYLAAQAPAGLRWALAGRSAQRLQAVRDAVVAAGGTAAAAAGIVEAAADDTRALRALAADTGVVLSTAGPFARVGSALVAACVALRTHYVDITGETPWVRGLIDAHHARAAHDGTRIIPCCGFDSVPSDLGAWLVAQALWHRHREPCIEVKACHRLRGGLNGGTLASALHLLDSGQSAQLAQPFLLNPAGPVPAGAELLAADPALPRRDDDFKAWVGPFVMGPVNTRVVRRSVALLQAAGDAACQPGWRYQEWLRYGRGPQAALMAGAATLGLAAGAAALQWAPARALTQRLAPAPGEGPSQAAINRGSFCCDLVGRTASGQVLRGRIAGRGDPGNRATTVFVCESALALALQRHELPGGPDLGGVLTPATGLGLVLAQRLAAAGMVVGALD
ncbi:saccharopine dehydrogenase family protein [Aquabacterium sp. OR-4]|uniref:saccharopine dehydrogenase family protein n=1 Tax=Aquabacterium sp. OR-4 TaxID=2978127 RepID=UPI0021B1B455|nr:saccharopine dehydrogenase NADP-binding domain-containing protein [Aquabacterium sp. OR-4]MDT7833608.1 saccharopine dehydrogenase NADP-binding domain-containing protein [Aquabacterium sp. OR-4]